LSFHFKLKILNLKFSLDPISDLLIRIQNGYMAYKKSIMCPASKIKIAILNILKKQGYITDFKESKETHEIEIILKYENKEPAMTGVSRVSKLGLRIYSGWKKLPKVMNGYGICIVTTSKGVMTAKDAKKLKMGGEVLCKVW
jgi:small subunit ribosomal protein S8